jgi:hypothetical protein
VNRPVVLAAVMLAVGAAAGWFARGAADGKQSPASALAGTDRKVDEASPAPAPPAVRTHDDELREILADPKAHALAAKVQNASRGDNGCEVEVDTSVGWFRVACGPGETPSVGEKLEVFGRVAATGQIDGVPPLLRPAWLEQPGTLARLRGP